VLEISFYKDYLKKLLEMYKHLAVLIVIGISSCYCAKFPAKIHKCRIGDTECIKATTNVVLKEFFSGEPRIALAAVDPLKISRMQLKQGGSSPVNIELNFHDVELRGLQHFTCIHMEGFTENPEGVYDMKFKGPKLVLSGPYSINGQILVLPIRGSGMSNFTLYDPELHVRFNGKVKNKNGKVHLYTDDLRMTFKISKMQAYFGNLFNGDRLLGETTNRFLNENWKDIFNEIKGSIFDAFSLITQSMLNSMWSHHDYKRLFLE